MLVDVDGAAEGTAVNDDDSGGCGVPSSAGRTAAQCKPRVDLDADCQGVDAGGAWRTLPIDGTRTADEPVLYEAELGRRTSGPSTTTDRPATGLYGRATAARALHLLEASARGDQSDAA